MFHALHGLLVFHAPVILLLLLLHALLSFLVSILQLDFWCPCSRRFAAVPLFHALVGYLVILTCLLVFLAPAGFLVFHAL